LVGEALVEIGRVVKQVVQAVRAEGAEEQQGEGPEHMLAMLPPT
jgi:hypothetical protein